MRLGLALALVACDREPAPLCEQSAQGENFLIIIADDVGIDKTSTYGEHEGAPPTPSLDALAERGLLFRNAYATPTCSPTRASLLTGRLPSRTGVGRWLYPVDAINDLELWELTLPEMLRRSPWCYTSMLAGKWHLVAWDRAEPARHPLLQGFDHHHGSLSNLGNAYTEGEDEDRGNYNWEKNTDGELAWTQTYAAQDTTDEALAFMDVAPEPWLLVASYNLAHLPIEVPPDELNLAGVTESSGGLEKYEASVVALDAEIGRLLDGLSEEQRARTTIVYLSDNGTDPDWIEPPWNTSRGKGSVYDGGVRVPFIVAGPHVAEPGSETGALVQVVDLFPTLAELAGVDVDGLRVEEGSAAGAPVELDGRSFLPVLEDPQASIREFVYTEGFYPNGDRSRDWHRRMVRSPDWKLIEEEEEGLIVDRSLYRYSDAYPDEGYDLLEQPLDAETIQAYARLQVEMDLITADLRYGY